MPSEELPAFVPAPKSLVSNRAATEVAAVNTNLTGDAHAVLTSMPKPIETAVTSINTPARTAQIALTSEDDTIKVGETRRFSLMVNSDASLALAVVALRFDPKVVKVRAVSAGPFLANVKDIKEPGASFTQSIDASGVCLISVSNLNGAALIKGTGTLLFIEVEALAAGDAGLVLDKGPMRLLGTDARDVALDVIPVRATVKQ